MSEHPLVHREVKDGAILLTIPEPSLPLVRFSFVLRHGAVEDPAGKAGRSRVMLELMLRGTTARNRAEWNRALERLGSQVGTTVASELALVHGIALKRNLHATLELVAEALLQPAFADRERADLVAELVEHLRSERDDDEALAELFWRRALYPGHPLARRPAGEPAELVALTAADVREAHATAWRRGELVVALGGDITPGEAAAAVSPLLAGLSAGVGADTPLPPMPEPRGLEVLLVDKPARTQAQLLVGRSAAAGNDADVHAFWLAVTAFGGTFTSRFTREVRDVRGWSYSAHADFGRRRPFKSPLVLRTAPAAEDAVDCLALELDLYRDLARGELEPGAVDFARTYLLNRHPLEVATAADLLLPAVRNELLGLAPDDFHRLPERLGATSGDDAVAALRRHLHPDNVIVVMVATAETMAPRLRARFPEARVRVVDFRDGLS